MTGIARAIVCVSKTRLVVRDMFIVVDAAVVALQSTSNSKAVIVAAAVVAFVCMTTATMGSQAVVSGHILPGLVMALNPRVVNTNAYILHCGEASVQPTFGRGEGEGGGVGGGYIATTCTCICTCVV